MQRAHTQSLLEDKTGAVTRLTERPHLLDIDLAILVADRGRCVGGEGEEGFCLFCWFCFVRHCLCWKGET